ncbi:MAG: TonB family protein [Acidobacteriota bacterium]
MKICPVCQSSCSDVLEYCPNDESALVAYDLRAELRARRVDNGPSAKEAFIFLLPEEWLPHRLRRELSGAVVELRRNPRLFLAGILRGDIDPRYRRSMGLSVAVVLTGVSACFTIALLIVGFLRPATAGADQEARKAEAPSRPERERVLTMVLAARKPKPGTRHSGASGGSLPERRPSQGGGGGGNQTEEPAERGKTAVAALQPVIIPPSPTIPKMAHASLIVPATVYADPSAFPQVKMDVGDPFGREGTRAAGPGEDFGIGPGAHGGIGRNNGPGFGPGNLMGSGGNGFQRGGGITRGNAAEDEIPWASGRVSPTIVYKEKARYTEEARQNQIQGTVILRATFSADGRITDIRVVRGLPNGLTENAIQAAQRIRFQPALNNGVPITVRASLEFNFALY